jgi:hypothetical protein
MSSLSIDASCDGVRLASNNLLTRTTLFVGFTGGEKHECRFFSFAPITFAFVFFSLLNEDWAGALLNEGELSSNARDAGDQPEIADSDESIDAPLWQVDSCHLSVIFCGLCVVVALGCWDVKQGQNLSVSSSSPFLTASLILAPKSRHIPSFCALVQWPLGLSPRFSL